MPESPDDVALPLADPASLPVAETFVSLQGEGKLAGVPSWFVRVSGCNLRCAWCDTPYASWNPEGTRRTVDDLVTEATGARVKHAVLTGGEPMIFAAIETLAHRLRTADLHVTIETAGTVFRPVEADLMSISPKLTNSEPPASVGTWAARHRERRINIEALQSLIDAHAEHQLKFVVANPSDGAEIDGILAQLRRWKPENVLLMPEGTMLPTQARAKAIADICVAKGWRYCHRLHIELFGNTRGT